jgi:hypothetical protein
MTSAFQSIASPCGRKLTLRQNGLFEIGTNLLAPFSHNELSEATVSITISLWQRTGGTYNVPLPICSRKGRNVKAIQNRVFLTL